MKTSTQLSAREAEVLDLVYAADFTNVRPTAAALVKAARCTPDELFAALTELRRSGLVIWYIEDGRTMLAPLRR